MNKIIISVGILLLLGTITAAIINEVDKANTVVIEDHTAHTPVDVSTSSSPIVGTTWEWQSSTNTQGTVTEPEDSSEFVLTFHADGRVTSTTDCNGVSGTYAAHGEVLSLSPLAATKMFCGEDTLETAYAGQLQTASSHVIEGDTLTLVLFKDLGTMTFTRVEEEASTSEE